MKKLAILTVLVGLLSVPTNGFAGGYDTPILYSARHIGMGGTAISYVNDPSALFHNPAGLSHTRFIDVTVDFTPVLGLITASPAFDGQNHESDLTFAPFFLAAGAFRVTDFMTLGLGVYPVASSGAGFTYTNNFNVDMEDRTKLVFIEVAPGVSFDLPGNVRIGANYRLTYLSFQRLQRGVGADTGMFDMDLSGLSFAGFKVGIQWTPVEWLQAGFVYRNKTTTTVEADSAMVVLQKYGHTEMDFILPSSFGLGVRADFDTFNLPFAIAVDAQYTLQSENESATIKAKSATGGTDLEVLNLYKWNDSITLRTGIEYKFLTDYRARLGYIFDGKVGNELYPTAFGTPPAANHSFTAGLGGTWGMFEVNLAYAYRMGSATVPGKDERDAQGAEPCLACSKGGDYSLSMHGFYLDTSVRF